MKLKTTKLFEPSGKNQMNSLGNPVNEGLLSVNDKKMNSLIKRWAKDLLNRHLTKEDIQMASRHMKADKVINITYIFHITYCKLRWQWDNTTHLYENGRVQNADSTKYRWGCRATGSPISLPVRMHTGTATVEHSQQFLIKLSLLLPLWSSSHYHNICKWMENYAHV